MGLDGVWRERWDGAVFVQTLVFKDGWRYYELLYEMTIGTRGIHGTNFVGVGGSSVLCNIIEAL